MAKIIGIRNVSFAWQDDAQNEMFQVADLSIVQNEHVLVHGPSGCGKSTLLSLVTGINRPDSGEMEVLGSNLRELSGPDRDRFRANNIGYIHQMFNLVPYLSVLDNVILPTHFSVTRNEKAVRSEGSVTAEARRLLDRLGISEKGLLKRKSTELSVGQQQRVAAARALMGFPSLIVADEPTASLDYVLRDELLELVFEESRQRGITVVLVSHDRNMEDRFPRSIYLPDYADWTLEKGESL